MTQAMSLIQKPIMTILPTQEPTLHQLVMGDEAAALQAIDNDQDLRVIKNINLLRESIPMTSKAEIQKIQSELATVARGHAMLLHVTVSPDVSRRIDKNETALYGDNMADITNVLADALQHELSMPVVRLASNVAQSDDLDTEQAHLSSLVESYMVSKQVSDRLRDKPGTRVHSSHTLHSLALNIGLDQGTHLGSAPVINLGAAHQDPQDVRMAMLGDVTNIISVTVNHETAPEALDQMIQTLNKDAVPGKLAVVFAMGADKVDAKLGGLLDVLSRHGDAAMAVCDPSAENATLAEMKHEATSFTRQCQDHQLHPAGLQLQVNLADIHQKDMVDQLVVPMARNQVLLGTQKLLRRG